MEFIKKFIVFLVVNFGSLVFGAWLMNNGASSHWYLSLNKAPWTPPGWVFGFAWTIIMICFSAYLASLFTIHKTIKGVKLFLIQFVLNISWNYIFFNQRLTVFGLITIILLTVVIFTFFFTFKSEKMKLIRLLLFPYMIWLCIATSLNAYIVLYN